MDNINPRKLEDARLDRMEQHQQELKKDLNVLTNDVREIKNALIGSSLVNDKGMVGKLKEIEEDLEILKDYRTKNAEHMKLIIWIGIIVGGALIAGIAKGLIPTL